MIKEFYWKNQRFEYDLKISKRTKNARISIFQDQSIIVTLPQKTDPSQAEKFLSQKGDWVVKQLIRFQRAEKCNPSLFKKDRYDYLKNKKIALEMIKQKIDEFQKIFPFQYQKISIRNQKTRWGSCSSSKNLNFNYKLIYLPENWIDYIIIHELCHLRYLNHSNKFWNLVSRLCPEYKKIIKEIKSI